MVWRWSRIHPKHGFRPQNPIFIQNNQNTHKTRVSTHKTRFSPKTPRINPKHGFRPQNPIFIQNNQNTPKTLVSTPKPDFHPKHPEYTQNTGFDPKTRFSPKTPRMHRKSDCRSEIEIFTQNTLTASEINVSIGNRDFHPKHAEYSEN